MDPDGSLAFEHVNRKFTECQFRAGNAPLSVHFWRIAMALGSPWMPVDGVVRAFCLTLINRVLPCDWFGNSSGY